MTAFARDRHRRFAGIDRLRRRVRRIANGGVHRAKATGKIVSVSEEDRRERMSAASDARRPRATASHTTRDIALIVVVALLAAMFAIVTAPNAANAAGNQDGVSGYTGRAHV